MARRNGTVSEGQYHSPNRGGIIALTPQDLEKLAPFVPGLDCAEYVTAAQAAQEKWGMAGVAMAQSERLVGAILIAPQIGIPPMHPLASGGIDAKTAGIILVWVLPGLSTRFVGRRLCITLSRLLSGQASGLEAQRGLITGTGATLAPARAWLVMMGFRRLRYPRGRYRLDFAGLVSWLRPRLQGLGAASFWSRNRQARPATLR
ncbi:MAG: hypothetical protein LBE83_09190 [Propionibacteriaceae bacterium]|jgi:hypothetical protein|nr:hypothetical protein [Propionibacteriaceae bacterium]